MTTALFLLRCAEIGISIRDLDLLTVGMVIDILTEKGNDDYYSENKKTSCEVIEATQEMFDRF